MKRQWTRVLFFYLIVCALFSPQGFADGNKNDKDLLLPNRSWSNLSIDEQNQLLQTIKERREIPDAAIATLITDSILRAHDSDWQPAGGLESPPLRLIQGLSDLGRLDRSLAVACQHWPSNVSRDTLGHLIRFWPESQRQAMEYINQLPEVREDRLYRRALVNVAGDLLTHENRWPQRASELLNDPDPLRRKATAHLVQWSRSGGPALRQRVAETLIDTPVQFSKPVSVVDIRRKYFKSICFVVASLAVLLVTVSFAIALRRTSVSPVRSADL